MRYERAFHESAAKVLQSSFRVSLEEATSSLIGNRLEVVSVRMRETSENSTVSLLVAVNVHLALVQTGLPSFSGIACNGHVRFKSSNLTRYSTVFVVGSAARLISSMCNMFDARHGLHYDEDSCRQPCSRTYGSGVCIPRTLNTALSWSNRGRGSGLKGLNVIGKDWLKHNMKKACDYVI